MIHRVPARLLMIKKTIDGGFDAINWRVFLWAFQQMVS